MKTKLFVFAMILVLTTGCSKDDTPVKSGPDPIQQPDPKPDPENRPPGDFELLSPEVDADREALKPTFSWEAATDPDGDSITYNLYVGTEEDPSTILAADLNGTSYQPAENLEVFANYHWKVVAKDTKGAESTTGTQSFLVKPKLNLKEHDFSGNKVKFSYDVGGLLSKITDYQGTEYKVFYTGIDFGKINKLANPRGNVTYTYDDQNRLSGMEYNGYNHLIAYDTNDRLVSSESRRIPNTNSNGVFKWTFFYESGAVFPSSSLYQLGLDNNDGTFTVDYEARDTFQWDEKGNLRSFLREVDEKRGDGFKFDRSITATYDDKQNPAYDIIKDMFGFDPFFINPIYFNLSTINLGHNHLRWISKNNVTTRTTTIALQDPLRIYEYSAENDYTYNVQGYPESATRKYIDPDNEIILSERSWTYEP